MEHNSDFKYDLELGIVGEKYLADALQNRKIEVKTDFKASETGNVYIEYKSRGKPSGVSTSESEWYAFVLSNDNIILVKTKKLKALVKARFKKYRGVKGGDSNTSWGVLLPITELLKI
jgi:hypothetical protein